MHALDIVILSALEVDVDFNVNVLVGSDGIIRGAVGGHPDTAEDSALSIIVCPLLRGRIPCVVPKVTTLITPGAGVDVVVTEYGIAVNPGRPEIAERLAAAGLKIVESPTPSRSATRSWASSWTATARSSTRSTTLWTSPLSFRASTFCHSERSRGISWKSL